MKRELYDALAEIPGAILKPKAKRGQERRTPAGQQQPANVFYAQDAGAVEGRRCERGTEGSRGRRAV